MIRRPDLPAFIKYSYPVALCANAYLKLRTRNVEKFIFAATTGRSGTLALANLLAAVPQCRALHEANPVMDAQVLHDTNFGELSSLTRRYRRLKPINIRRASVGYRYYVETNHLFIKTFVEQVAREFGDRLEVIHLVRAPLDVALSIFRLNEEPGTDMGNRWWLDHRAPLNRIRIADVLDHDGEFTHRFYKALWYWFEVEERIREWRGRLPHIRFHRFETEWLNDQRRVVQLLEELELPFDETRIASRIGNKDNTRMDEKQFGQLSRDGAQEMLERFQELLARRGLLRSDP